MRTDSSFISLWEPTIAYCSGLPAFSLARVQAWRPWAAHAHVQRVERPSSAARKAQADGPLG